VVGLQQLSKLSVCECVKDADVKGKEADVQSLQHRIRNPDLAEVSRCV
jgi:hypothetical protein